MEKLLKRNMAIVSEGNARLNSINKRDISQNASLCKRLFREMRCPRDCIMLRFLGIGSGLAPHLHVLKKKTDFLESKQSMRKGSA